VSAVDQVTIKIDAPHLPSGAALVFRAQVGNAIWMNQWHKVLEVVNQARGRPELGAILGIDGTFGEGSPLLSAVEEGQTTVVSAMIKAGADPNSRDKWDRAMLLNAVAGRNIEMAKCLLRHGADINAGGPTNNTALGLAIAKGSVEEAIFLIDAGASQVLPESPLELAVEHDRRLMVRALLARDDLSVPACGALFDDVLARCRSEEVRGELLAWRSERDVLLVLGGCGCESARQKKGRAGSVAL
jgi:ankyrin repeat protein